MLGQILKLGGFLGAAAGTGAVVYWGPSSVRYASKWLS